MVGRISILRNPVQYYAWGSRTAIPDLLGIPNPEGKPMAELWMGAHPKAPSEVLVQERWISLIEVVKSSPVSVLGKEVIERFGNQFPFLFKVLAAAEPLSIQVHPNLEQAKEGFKRENRMGIPLDSPVRNYRDDNHKPEMLCALSQFEALKGFRPVDEILYLLDQVSVPELGSLVERLKNQPNKKGLEVFFTSLLRLDSRDKSHIVSRLAGEAARLRSGRREFYWVEELAKKYPEDIGVLSPILFNLTQVEPGHAIFLAPGQPHAYLKGTGLEIMANSDNVLRGGLTPKHIDLDELLKIIDFESSKLEEILPLPLDSGEEIYKCPAQEFQLSRIRVKGRYNSRDVGSVEILLCVDGEGQIMGLNPIDHVVEINKGMAVIVPSINHPYEVRGELTLWKATVPV